MARPRKPLSKHLSQVVTFRLTAAEYAQFTELATRANLHVNALVRIVALSRREHVTVKTYAAYDPALLAELHRIGLNLNQLVKYAHCGRLSPRIEELCAQIERMITEAAEHEVSS